MQDNLKALTLIALERDIALQFKTDKEHIVVKFVLTSKELSSLLFLQITKDYNKSQRPE